MKYNYTQHMFMTGQTIHAVLKKYNNMVADDDTLSALVDEFNKINNNAVPRIGSVLQIPVLENDEEN